MNTKEEYNQHLQQFYANTYTSYLLENGFENSIAKTEAEKFCNKALWQYGSAFNNNLAYDFLIQLDLKNPILFDKLDNYPSMFWKTYEGKETLRNLSYKEGYKVIEMIKDTFEAFSEISDSQKINSDYTNNFKNLITNYLQVVRKIALTDSEIAHSGLTHFEGYIKHHFENYKETPVYKQLVSAVSSVYEQEAQKLDMHPAYSNINAIMVTGFNFREIDSGMEIQRQIEEGQKIIQKRTQKM